MKKRNGGQVGWGTLASSEEEDTFFPGVTDKTQPQSDDKKRLGFAELAARY
jgi:secreted PhoX family phosphatase